MGEICFRPSEENDYKFIISSWVTSARKGERHTFMSNRDYFSFYRQKVIVLMMNSLHRIIYDADYPKVIMGYAVYTFTPQMHLILHYVYIRKGLWNQKYAKQLIENIYPDFKTKPIITTSVCIFQQGHNKMDDGKVVGHKDGLTDRYNITYNPYLLSKDLDIE